MCLNWQKNLGHLLVAICLISLTSCMAPLTTQTDNAATGTDESIQHSTELDNIVSELTNADYILLGEVHGTAEHHQWQSRILEWIAHRHRYPSVVFEMFDREDAEVILATAKQHPNNADTIAEVIDWDRSGWPDWELYKPVVESALFNNMPIIAGNFSRKEAMQLVLQKTEGKTDIDILSIERRAELGLDHDITENDARKLRQKLLAVHEMKDETMIEAMLLAQKVRDAVLAESLMSNNTGAGAVLIAGREHTRQDYGVPHYIRTREPEAKIVSIIFATPADKREIELESKKSGQLVFDVVLEASE